ncbi:MAG: hypothetical protein JO185_08370 [Acidobacteriaceae bacterium]|nr:hypothetical protein [Acidobacteriaceae bacterium]
MDVIPSDLVESVEISKTPLANQDGDAIGGSVNVRTRTASDRPAISLFGIGAFTPVFNTCSADQFGGTVGKRFGKDQRLGILFGGTYDWNGRGINDVEPGPQTVQCDPGYCGAKPPPSANAPYFGTYSGIDLRDYAYDRTRFGFEGSVDYRLSDSASVYMRGLYSHFRCSARLPIHGMSARPMTKAVYCSAWVSPIIRRTFSAINKARTAINTYTHICRSMHRAACGSITDYRRLPMGRT